MIVWKGKKCSVAGRTARVTSECDRVGSKTDQVARECDRVGSKTDQVARECDRVASKTAQVPGITARLQQNSTYAKKIIQKTAADMSVSAAVFKCKRFN